MISRVPVYPFFIALNLVLGWFIPWFYRWTGSNQSNAAPVVGQVALAMSIGGLVVCILLPFLPIKQETNGSRPIPLLRFSLRTLFGITASIGLGIVGLMKFPNLVSGLIFVAVLIHLIWFTALNRHQLWPTAALVGCMYLPFAWVVGYDELDNIWKALIWILAGVPALLPSALISNLIGQNLHESQWLSVVITATTLFVGPWIISLGPKWTIGSLVIITPVSLFSSFCLHALVLA